jgi:hypothetical protein
MYRIALQQNHPIHRPKRPSDMHQRASLENAPSELNVIGPHADCDSYFDVFRQRNRETIVPLGDSGDLSQHMNERPDFACRLILTGHRSRTRYALIVNGSAVWLTATCFLAAIDLVLARLSTLTGYSPIPSSCTESKEGIRLVVHRLRKAIHISLPIDDLITSDGNTNYALNVPRHCLGVDQSFFELPVPSVISVDAMSGLRRETR